MIRKPELTLKQKKEALSFIMDCLANGHPAYPLIRWEGICTIMCLWYKNNTGNRVYFSQLSNLSDVFPELAALKKQRTILPYRSYWFNNAEERLVALNSIQLCEPKKYWWYEGFIFYKIGYNNSLGHEVIMRRIFK